MEVDHQEVNSGNTTTSKEPQTINSSGASPPASSATVIEVRTETDPTVVSHREMTFSQKINQFQLELEDDFQAYETSLQQNPHDNDIGLLDWDDLEKRYDDEMGLRITAENEVMDEFSALFKVLRLLRPPNKA